MTLDVLDGGFLTTVQDGGRRGYERFGVPPAGPMDPFALAAANLLTGNPEGAAALEMTAAGPFLYVWHDCVLALAGGGFRMAVDGREYPAWMSVFVRAGARVTFPAEDTGQWGYLAVSGGFDLPAVLGSRSTYLRGHFGGVEGRTLQAGDRLPTRAARLAGALQAGKVIPADARPAYDEHPLIRVVPGGQVDAFTEEGLAAFTRAEFLLSPAVDRMGFRFSGPKISHRSSADILSDGIVTGAVQVPADGQPLVLMSDRQTTGGYTKLGAVARADLPLLAQCRPGTSRVRFAFLPVEAAQAFYRQQMKRLRAAVIEREEDQLRYQRF